MALEVTARLKYPYKVLAEVVASQDRKMTWSDAHFPANVQAHYGMMCSLIHAEVQASLRGDADIVVTDRSVLDLFSIAITDHPADPLIGGLHSLMAHWMNTYDRIYYLPPLEYQHDGKRPPDEFRQRTHASLIRLIQTCESPNVIVGLTRDEMVKDIRSLLGLQEIKPIFAEEEKWQALCDVVGFPLVVKEPKSPITSDIDIWFLVPPSRATNYTPEYALSIARLYFGDQVDLHVMAAPDTALAKLSQLGAVHQVYNPN